MLAPPLVRTDEAFVVQPILTCPAQTPVQEVSVELVGLLVYYTSSQYGQHRNDEVFCRAHHVVRGEGTLDEGEHRFDVRFSIGPKFPASYSGKRLRIEWEIRVHVDIAWWPDARARFGLAVTAASGPQPQGTTHIWASRREGPLPRKPYFELSLGSTHVEPGGKLTGAIALANVAHNDYRRVELTLVAEERLEAGLMTLHEQAKHGRWVVPLDEAAENEPVRFSLQMPTSIGPAFSLARAGLRWFLRADVDVAWSVDPHVWVPLTVQARPREPRALAPAPLAVGAERIELNWRNVAETTGFNYVDGQLRRGVGHLDIEVRREHRGKKGVYLVADLRYPDLGIGLSVADEAGPTARDADHTRILREHLDAAWAYRRPVDGDDRTLTLELANAGHSVEPLHSFVRHAHQVATALEAARVQLPAPATLREQLAQWRRAARGLGGRLRVYAMRIEGSRDEMPFLLGVTWKPSGELDEYVVRVQPPHSLAQRHHVQWRADGPAPEAGSDVAGLTELTELTEKATRIRIDASRLEVALDPEQADLEAAVSRLERMLDLARRLSGRVGPYR